MFKEFFANYKANRAKAREIYLRHMWNAGELTPKEREEYKTIQEARKAAAQSAEPPNAQVD